MLPPLTFMVDLTMNLMSGLHHKCERKSTIFRATEVPKNYSDEDRHWCANSPVHALSLSCMCARSDSWHSIQCKMGFPVPKKTNKLMIPTLCSTNFDNSVLRASFYFFQVDYKWKKKKKNWKYIIQVKRIFLLKIFRN